MPSRVTLDGREADPEQTGCFTFTWFLPEGFHYLPAQGRQSLFKEGQIAHYEAVRALDGRRELKGNVFGGSSPAVLNYDVEVGQSCVVF